MKRIIALCFCLIFVFTFAGCKKDKTEGVSGYDIDIAYYLSSGQINEAKYHIGTNPDDIERDAEKQQADHNHEGEDEHEGADGHEGVITYTMYGNSIEAYICDGFQYCYNVGQEEKGISCIVAQDTAFGFVCGTSYKHEVKNAVSSLSPVESDAESNELFYSIYTMNGVSKITCTKNKYQLTFYFYEDILDSVVIVNTETWDN